MEQANAVELVAKANRVKVLCRNVFSTTEGRELLAELRSIYCDGKLYCNTDRDTVYFVAQRDLVLELGFNADATIDGVKPNGEDVS